MDGGGAQPAYKIETQFLDGVFDRPLPAAYGGGSHSDFSDPKLQRRARRCATINVIDFSDVTTCQNMVDVSDVITCQNIRKVSEHMYPDKNVM